MYMHHEDATLRATALLPCACTTLRKAARAVSRVYDAALAPAGLTTTQFAIIRSVAKHGGMPLSRLADALVMERTSLYRTLSPMTRAGWIRIDAGPRGRARLATATAEGLAAMREATPAWEDAQARIIGAVGREDWTDLGAALDGLVAVSAAA
jgi:DNA-binding MarR family transcriptional regulator